MLAPVLAGVESQAPEVVLVAILHHGFCTDGQEAHSVPVCILERINEYPLQYTCINASLKTSLSLLATEDRVEEEAPWISVFQLLDFVQPELVPVSLGRP